MASEVQVSELKSFLQLGFSYVDHLVTKMLAGGMSDTTERIYVESLCDRFIG
jgi:hypothetical protein